MLIVCGVQLKRRTLMKISFQFPEHEYSIEIISKYTCFIGKDSGEGKTELLSLIEITQ